MGRGAGAPIVIDSAVGSRFTA
jgi:hypothetical protein